MSVMVFEREGSPPQENLSPQRLTQGLSKLKSYGKSSFASITRPDGSYLQVGGGGTTCLLEWRDAEKGRHLRGFVEDPTVPFEDGTELSFGGGRIALQRDEWLKIELVTEAFVAFSAGEALPPSIHWRDVSEVLGLR